MNDKRKCGDNHCYCHNIQEIRMSPHFFLTSRADCRTLRPGTHSFDRRNRNLRSVAPRPENNRTPAVAGSLQRLDASRGCDRCSHHLRVRNLRCGRHDMLRGSSGKNLHTLRRSGRRRAGSGVIPAARCHLHASQPDQPLKRRIPEKTKGILFSNFFRHEFAPTFSAFAKNPLERIFTLLSPGSSRRDLYDLQQLPADVRCNYRL